MLDVVVDAGPHAANPELCGAQSDRFSALLTVPHAPPPPIACSDAANLFASSRSFW